MTKIFCDFCGEDISNDNTFQRVRRRIWVPNRYVCDAEIQGIPCVKVDLCRDCFRTSIADKIKIFKDKEST